MTDKEKKDTTAQIIFGYIAELIKTNKPVTIADAESLMSIVENTINNNDKLEIERLNNILDRIREYENKNLMKIIKDQAEALNSLMSKIN